MQATTAATITTPSKSVTSFKASEVLDMTMSSSSSTGSEEENSVKEEQEDTNYISNNNNNSNGKTDGNDDTLSPSSKKPSLLGRGMTSSLSSSSNSISDL